MRVSSSGQGPRVVKIAGIAGGVGLYREEMDRAVAAGFRVAALETTGDRRDDPASSMLTWDTLCAEVADAVESMGGSALLWGTSFGSILALATAVRHPQLVSGLLLCHPPDPRNPPRLHVGFYRWLKRQRIPERHAAQLFKLAFLTLNGWELLSPCVLWRLPRLARESVRAATPGSTVLQKLDLLWEGDPIASGRTVSIPSAIIAGRWDGVAPHSGARAIAAQLPDATFHLLGFSGHAGAYSRPRTYAKIAIAELERVSGRERDRAYRTAPLPAARS